jgi:hypothetical protein
MSEGSTQGLTTIFPFPPLQLIEDPTVMIIAVSTPISNSTVAYKKRLTPSIVINGVAVCSCDSECK